MLANYMDDFIILAKAKKELEERIIQFYILTLLSKNTYSKSSSWTRRSTDRKQQI